MKVYQATVRGREQWVLDMRLDGTRKRRFFDSHQKAVAAMAKTEKDIENNSELFARYSGTERMRMVLAFRAANEMGSTIEQSIVALKEKLSSSNHGHTIGEMVGLFLDDKLNEGCRDRTMSAWRSTLNRFAKGRDNHTAVSVKEVKDWILSGKNRDGHPWGAVTRNTILSDLKSFFNWAVENEYIQSNPILKIKKFKSTPEEERRKEEREESLGNILPNESVQLLLETTRRDDPEILPYVAILFFAGLRPEREATGVRWQDVLLDEGLLYVRPRKAKDRQSRYVKIEDNLKAWASLGGKLPPDNIRKRWATLRKKCGLFGDSWPHDAARHTFASNYLALHGADATVEALGHGDYEMLFKHYRSLVKPKDAERYFKISP